MFKSEQISGFEQNLYLGSAGISSSLDSHWFPTCPAVADITADLHDNKTAYIHPVCLPV